MEVIESLKHRTGFSDINFQVNVPKNLHLFTNEFIFSSIIQNLIDNSIKYKSSLTPYISITAENKTNTFHLTVKDNGIGIPFEYQGKIFDMFFRGTEQAEGSGLGLYIVKSNILRMGGEIKLKSIPNNGTQFFITFPNNKTKLNSSSRNLKIK